MPVDAAKSQENYQRYVYLRDRGHLDFVRKAERCDSFFAGEQWRQEDLVLLKQQRRPAMTINKILNTISNILGEQIQNRVETLFRPKNGSPAEVAEALTKVWMYVAQQNQLEWLRSDVFCDGIVRSRGFFDVRMEFLDSMQGKIVIDQMNSKNVIIDSDADSYDPDDWSDVFVTKWLSPQDITLLYNADDGEYLSGRGGTQSLYGMDSIERTRDSFGGSIILPDSYTDAGDNAKVRRNIRVLERQYRMLDKVIHFVDIETGDMRPVPSEWDRNRISSLLEKAQGRVSTTKKLVKRIRWCVTADNVVLHDEWSPYKHFTVVPYFPHFRYGKTIGVVENLLGPQEILNKVSSQELHIVNTTANSGWVVEQNSLVNMTVGELEQKGATTGLVIEYKAGMTPPEKILPNQTPTGLDRISYKAEEHIKSISGVSDSMQGFDRADVAAKAIAYKRESGSVNMTKVLDNLERTDYILARNVLDLIQGYMTEPQILNITHSDLTHSSDSVAVNQVDPVTGSITNDLTMGEFDITISTTPSRDTTEDSQFEQARGLREIGVKIPDSVLIENSRLTNRADIIKLMEGDQSSPEAQAQAQLKQRNDEATVAGAEADVALKQAQAGKAKADSARAGAEAVATAAETQAAATGGGEAAAQAQTLQMTQAQHNADLQAKYETMAQRQHEFEQKMTQRQQEHEQALELAQNNAAHDRQLKQEAADAQRVQELRKAQQESAAALPTS